MRNNGQRSSFSERGSQLGCEKGQFAKASFDWRWPKKDRFEYLNRTGKIREDTSRERTHCPLKKQEDFLLYHQTSIFPALQLSWAWAKVAASRDLAGRQAGYQKLPTLRRKMGTDAQRPPWVIFVGGWGMGDACWC